MFLILFFHLMKVHTDKSLTEVEVSRVGAMVKILKDTSHYHATSFAGMDISLILKVLQAWPPAMMFPGRSSDCLSHLGSSNIAKSVDFLVCLYNNLKSDMFWFL